MSDPALGNLGPGERRKRLIVGYVFLGISAAFVAYNLATGQDRTWRLVLFAPLMFGVLGLLQAQGNT